MNTNDPMFEALDRLARVADAHPAGDPMPGIKRKARANRRRATALTVAGFAAVVAAGVGVSSAIGFPQLGREPGYAGTPTTSVGPTTPSTPAPTPTLEPTDMPTDSPSGPPLAEHDRASADVDGDGTDDVIRIMVPEDVAGNQDLITSEDTRLQIELAAGATVEAELDMKDGPGIKGSPDLDNDGDREVIFSYGGGDAEYLQVFTLDGDTLAQATPADNTPADLLNNAGDLQTIAAEIAPVAAALVDDNLISWVPTDDQSAPFEVRVWSWQMDGTSLVAVEEEEFWCQDAGEYPTTC